MNKNDFHGCLGSLGSSSFSPSYTTSSIKNVHWVRDDGLRRLNAWICLLLLSSYASGFDGSLLNGLQAVPQWQRDFGRPTGNILGVLSMSGALGGVIAPWLFQWLADRYGRVRSLHIGTVVAILGSLLTVIRLPEQVASQRAIFIGSRIIQSFGAAAGPSCAAVLIAELAHPRHRSAAVSLYNGGFYVGAVVAAWMTFGSLYWSSSWAWRLPCLFQALPFVLQLFLLPFCPESPRWLVSQGRSEDAIQLLARYHSNGDVSSPLVRFELSEIQEAIRMEKQVKGNASYADLFRTPGNRWRLWIIVTMAFGSQWCGNAIGSYYLSPILGSLGITRPLEQAGLNVGLTLWNLVIASTAAFRSNKLGRRPMLLTSAGGMLVSFTLITIFSARFASTSSSGYGVAVIVFLFIFSAFYSWALTPFSFAYPAEVLQYSLRARGMALHFWLVSLALIFNIWVNPIALEHIGWKLYLVYIGVLLLMGINFFFTYPETRGRTMEEIAEIFDGTLVQGSEARM